MPWHSHSYRIGVFDLIRLDDLICQKPNFQQYQVTFLNPIILPGLNSPLWWIKTEAP